MIGLTLFVIATHPLLAMLSTLVIVELHLPSSGKLLAQTLVEDSLRYYMS